MMYFVLGVLAPIILNLLHLVYSFKLSQYESSIGIALLLGLVAELIPHEALISSFFSPQQ